jgi:hypothetical protein
MVGRRLVCLLAGRCRWGWGRRGRFRACFRRVGRFRSGCCRAGCSRPGCCKAGCSRPGCCKAGCSPPGRCRQGWRTLGRRLPGFLKLGLRRRGLPMSGRCLMRLRLGFRSRDWCRPGCRRWGSCVLELLRLGLHDVALLRLGRRLSRRRRSGDCSSGDRSSGDRSSGDRSSGDRSSGHCLSGHCLSERRRLILLRSSPGRGGMLGLGCCSMASRLARRSWSVPAGSALTVVGTGCRRTSRIAGRLAGCSWAPRGKGWSAFLGCRSPRNRLAAGHSPAGSRIHSKRIRPVGSRRCTAPSGPGRRDL